MNKIPQLKKKLEIKSCHNIKWEDNYSWIHQENILEVLQDKKKLNPEVENYLNQLVSLVSRVILFLRIGLFLMIDARLIARLDNLENPKNISKSMLFISCHSAIIFI